MMDRENLATLQRGRIIILILISAINHASQKTLINSIVNHKETLFLR